SLGANPPVSPPMVAHLAIAIGMAFVLLYILIDTRRINDVPPFRWLGKLIAIDRRLDTVERALFEGYKTQDFRIKDGVATGGARVEETPDDPDYRRRLILLLEHHAVPNALQSLEDGVNPRPQTISLDRASLSTELIYV